ncbi:N-acetylmuramoyl-L-alanine amidase [Polaribacter reichenbachii]|uniref:N-acetylmuramoyl-L-alanine amidase n=1 Tax=Polaribacter reichenbachii TaxID=996801 RepID=A0A1B8U4H0_9FLAO|nr:N-acetylmuramoyl-L-alanine amidase [Polaribacter reichenbachii]APZ47517.1 N-acetylmuramoyl-L-alanine amidase [Polaribacter reichenbachii]AUC18156.1 N-acetylmuramoyl-L-alanine amidase [Polaribacter reichenbachii]OBY66767.1 N-acetylmuramoyl-L-alanine amidase [Polaribacter reichenbachii]
MNKLPVHKFCTTLKNVFFLVILLSIFCSSSVINAQKVYTIVLDAGHGGKDPGNLGNGYKEKDIALKVALIVGKSLSKEKDIKVIYTRKTDTYPDLWKRGEIANTAKADLFVSIHCDSHTSNAYGAGTFVLGLRGNKKNLEIAKRENASILLYEDNYQEKYEGFDSNSAESVIGLSLLQEENLDKSLEIASLIQNNFAYKLRRNNRKVKQDNFQVLRETIMPSVLVELGFLTNRNEGRYLNSSKGQQQMGKAIVDAIKIYINNLKLNTVGEQIIESSNLEVVEFKIQIASGKNKIPTKSYNFKGLKNVQRVKVGSYYKYYYGVTSSYKNAQQALKTAKQKGYKSAFMVAFKNGEKVAVKDVYKMN